MLENEAKEFVNLLVDHVKGLYDPSDVGSDRLPMYYKGEWDKNSSYSRGDVVTIRTLGIFQAVKDTRSDPRQKGVDNWVTIYAASGGAGSGGTPLVPVMQVDRVLVLANGQTLFSLSTMPVYASTVIMNINGVDYYSFGDFTLAGTVVTWTNMFSLTTTDRVVFRYF